MNHPNLKKKFQCYYEKLLLSETVQLVTFIVKDFDRHATYCYVQVDLKSFLASGAFFLGREATERATISQVINSRHS